MSVFPLAVLLVPHHPGRKAGSRASPALLSIATQWQSLGRAAPFSSPEPLCLPKTALQAAQGKLWGWEWWDHQLTKPPWCPSSKLPARATFSQQAPFTELVPSTTLSTAEQHSGTQNHWTCSSAGLFIVSSGAARQKAKRSPVSKSKSLMIPPENQEHTSQTGARDQCRHRQGNSALWTSLHPNTTLTSTFIRKAKWGIITTPPQRRTALQRQ